MHWPRWNYKRVALFLCFAFLMSGLLTPFTAVQTAFASDGKPISVVSDDTRDAYVGTGGLLLPGSFTGTHERKKFTSECLDCVWTYRLQCANDLHDMCMKAALSCPSGTIRYEVWIKSPRASSQQIGTVCWGKSEPVTRQRLATEISQRSLQYVPPLIPGVTPHGETMQGIANYFWAGQPSIYRSQDMLLSGVHVRVRATPMWLWQWGDGTSQWTRQSGVQSIQSPLSHTFSKSGSYRISVKTIWQARYDIVGYGSFPVIGRLVSQQASLNLVVRRQHVALSGT